MKGKDLEKTILELFKHYALKDIFCLRIHEHKISTGQVVEKSPFDFIIYHMQKMIAFDTKECSGNTINIKTNFKMHQLEAMLQIIKNGGEAFFLVYFFQNKKLVKFYANDVLEYIKNDIKSLTWEDGIETKLDILGVL